MPAIASVQKYFGIEPQPLPLLFKKIKRRVGEETFKILRIPFKWLDFVVAPFGYEVIRKHFYSPMPLGADLDSDLVRNPSPLLGVEIDAAECMALGESLTPYFKEFNERFPLHKDKSRSRFYLVNGGYMAVDAHIYWGLIRATKPKRIVEIGAGFSTMVAAEACLYNERETGKRPELIAVEPYPGGLLDTPLPGLARLIGEKVQNVDMRFWDELEANDVLFIDSSHVLAMGNDVHYEYLELIPRLKPGVLIHIHDIGLPVNYPQGYMDLKLYWNEQYLLQAFLAFNSKFKVIWPGYYLYLHDTPWIFRLFPQIKDMQSKYPQAGPSSFWIKRVE